MRKLILFFLAAAAPVSAAERKLFVSSFDRLRVDGPFRVIVTSGRSPAGSATGDSRQLDDVEVRQESGTVFVRRLGGRADARAPTAPAQPVVVTLSTPSLAAVYLVGPGEVSAAGMKAVRVDISVAGTGTIAVTGADATQLNATSIGTGRVTIAGRAVTTRLIVNGQGGIAAGKLETSELTVRLDGPGAVTARARYTANVTNTGLGSVAIAGSAKCIVKAVTSGSVTCGSAQAR